jgi:hypothetical protein
MRRGRRSPVVTVASDGLGAGPCAGGISLVGGDAGAGLHVLVAVVRGRIKAWRRPLPDGDVPQEHLRVTADGPGTVSEGPITMELEGP